MDKEQRAVELMLKGPINNVKKIIELEDELDRTYIVIAKLLTDNLSPKEREILKEVADEYRTSAKAS